jgi:arginine/lysine/ornithine decarboxylase
VDLQEGPGDTEESLSLLVKAFENLSREYYGKRPSFRIPRADFFERPKTVIAPRDAFYGIKKSVPIQEASGEISGESIMIYPPGIPLVIPGERITDQIIEHYNFYVEQNCIIMNDDGNTNFIKVLGE